MERLRPLLKPMEQPAMSVAVAGRAEPFRVVLHDEGDIVAVDPETGETQALDAEDVVLWKLDAGALLRGVAAALGLVGTPASVGMGSRIWWLGEFTPFEGERFPVYLATTRDAVDLTRSAGMVAALSRRPFVLVTPTRSGASEPLERLVEGRDAAWITLEESLTWEGEGAFRARRPVQEMLAVFVDRHAPRPATTKESPRFPTPAGTAWEDVAVRFKDGHTVSVTVRDRSAMLGYAGLGMGSSKNNAPTRQWGLLRAFAEEHGVLTWASRKASPKHRKQKQLLADALRRFFGIDGDPFVIEDGGWRARFRVEADQ